MATGQHIGARHVPKFAEPVEWNNETAYEQLTIVYWQGNSYTSRQAVPKGTDISNTDYWAITGNYNALIEQYRKEVEAATENVATLQGQMATANENISELRGQIVTANESVSELQGQIATANENISELQGQIAAANENINAITSDLDNVKLTLYTPLEGAE